MKQKTIKKIAVVSFTLLFALGFINFARANGSTVNGSACTDGTSCQSGNCNLGGRCEACSNDLECVGAGSTCNTATGVCWVASAGTAGKTCTTPGTQSNCQAGLTCGADSICGLPDANPNITPGATCTGTGQGSCALGLVCGTDHLCALASSPPTGSCSTTASASQSNCASAGGNWSNNSCTGCGSVIPPNASFCNNDPNLTYSNGVCLPKSSMFPTTGIAASSSLSELIVKIIQLLLTFAGIIGVVMLVLGGYWYMAAGGNEEMSEKGKKTIINFVLGLVVIILAYTIVTIIAQTLVTDKLIGN